MKVDSLIAANPAVKSRSMITGYSFIAGQGNTYGTIIVKLKDWGERDGKKGQDLNSVIGSLYVQSKMGVSDANVLIFAPPMIPGYSATNGFELNLQDKTGGDLDKFSASPSVPCEAATASRDRGCTHVVQPDVPAVHDRYRCGQV